jgi:hypothetical protein
MTSTPQEPLDQPVDVTRDDVAEENPDNEAKRTDTEYLDAQVLQGPPGDSRGH